MYRAVSAASLRRISVVKVFEHRLDYYWRIEAIGAKWVWCLTTRQNYVKDKTLTTHLPFYYFIHEYDYKGLSLLLLILWYKK